MKTIKKILLSGLFGLLTTLSMANGTGSIYSNQQEIMTYEVKDPTCHNSNDGSIEINIVSGDGYLFSWDNGLSVKNLYNLSDGVYRVKIETSQNEIIWASFTIESPKKLQGVITQDNFDGVTSLNLTVEGGTSPYNYVWSNDQTTEDIYGILDEGIYEVNILDSNGCSLNLGTYVINEQTTSLSENIISDVNNELIYNLEGKEVVLENSPSGMYLIVKNGVVINKIIKSN